MKLVRNCKNLQKLVKGIVSWNKMTFGRFHCIAGNFLMIRCRILNFKISISFSCLKSIVFAASFRTARDLSHRKVKIPRRAVNPPTEYKQFIISHLPHGENCRFLFMFCIDGIKFTTRWEIFTVRLEKFLAVLELVQSMYRARNETANTHNKLWFD
jgi:hypothetical protein